MLIIFSSQWEDGGSRGYSIAYSAYPPPTSNPNPYPPPGSGLTAPTNTPSSKSLVSVNITAITQGLEPGEIASFELIPEAGTTQDSVDEFNLIFPSVEVKSNGTNLLEYKLPEGSYLLQINAPSSYFREPKGYFIRISEYGLELNRPLNQFAFNLVPSNKQDLPPCRVKTLPTASTANPPNIQKSSDNSNVVCRAERMIDLVGPFLNPETSYQQEFEIEGDSGYQYAGPRTLTDNYGVWGRSFVVDPSVFHNNDQWPYQFWAQRVYTDNGTNTLEAGWDELSWKDAKQYIYVEGTDTSLPPGQRYRDFLDFGLTVGSVVEVKIYYDPSLGKWKAILNLGGSWATLKEVDPGFTMADNGYNRVEGYTDTETFPAVPPSLFDTGYLCIYSPCSNWYSWNTDFASSTTYTNDGTPYFCDMVTRYYRFIVHSHLTFHPLIRK